MNQSIHCLSVVLLVVPSVLPTGAAEFMGLGYLPNGDHFVPQDLSADGTVVVGYSWGEDRPGEATRWSAETGYVRMGDLPGGEFHSRAHGVFADGSIIVGWGVAEDGMHAFRWTEATGIVGLGNEWFVGSTAGNDISADGTVVIGSTYLDCGDDCKLIFEWAWTEETGPDPPGSCDGNRWAVRME